MMVAKATILESHRIGETLIVTPLADLAELEFARIEAEQSNVLRLFQLSQIKNVVLDLERSDYSGSSAISFFLKLWKEVQSRGGKMALCNVSPHADQVLQVCKLKAIWPICESRAEALAAVQ